MKIPVWKDIRKRLAGGACLLGVVSLGLSSNLEKEIIDVSIPVFNFAARERQGEYEKPPWGALFLRLPVFSYYWEENPGGTFREEETLTDAEIPVEEAIPIEEALLEENESAVRRQESVSQNEETEIKQQAEETINEMPMADFLPHEKQMTYHMADYQEFTTLFDTFYAMDSNTMVGREQLNTESLLGTDITVDKTSPGPQILIYHTHSQEGFADSVAGDASTSIVGAGEQLAQLLTEKYGYQVLHHTGQYDVPDRDSAYARSLPALEQLLQENPQIQVVIDLHRDGVAANRRLMTEIDGRKTAQFMFFNGLSRTKNTGDIDYLKNPYQAQNLALSFQAQKNANEYYPGLTRKIYLNGYRYNMHLRKSMLIELGAQTNTVEEIRNAVEPLAHVLDLTFSGKAVCE